MGTVTVELYKEALPKVFVWSMLKVLLRRVAQCRVLLGKMPNTFHQENTSRVEGLTRLTRLTDVANLPVRNLSSPFFLTNLKSSDSCQYCMCITPFQNIYP